LMEVSESVQRKYLEQSAAVSMAFLASGLSLGATCDINYKASKNQKLHVEIFLLKLSQLPHLLNLANLSEGEKKNLVSQAPANTPVAVQPSVIASQPVSSVPSAQPVTAVLKPTGLKSTVGLAAKPTVAEEPTAAIQKTQQIRQEEPFGLTQLQQKWDSFVTELEAKERFSEMVILKRPFRLEGTTIHLAVDNGLQVELLNNAMRTEVLTYLRKELKNSTIHLEISIAEVEIKRMPYTQAEKFQFLLDKNPAMIDLKTALGLDYDY
jgi:DNA polymerase III subunit gamma/tau